jgi:hypothetical protein
MRKSLTYTNSEYSFSVNYPVDWNVKEDLVELVVIFGGPSVLEGIYDVNINVNAERLHQEIALEDFVTASDLKARRTIPN